MIHEAVEGHLEVMVFKRIEIPEPLSRIRATGEFLVRSNPVLHMKLIRKQREAGYKSLNKFIVEQLETIV